MWMAVLVEVGGRDAARRLQLVPRGPPDLDEGAVPLVAEEGVGLIALVGLVAAHVEVEEAVAVEVAPDGPEADLHRQRRELHLLERAALDVAIELAAIPAEQVEVAVVVEVAPDGRPSHAGDLREALAFLVAPDLAADAQVDPAVVVE